MKKSLKNIISVIQLDDIESEILIEELLKLDKNLKNKVKKIMELTDSKISEALEYVITKDPVLWAKVYLNWEARGYQIVMLREGAKSNLVVLRLGRRLGKTDCQCILILWHACTQINKGPNNQYDVLIFTPYETQIDLIFKRLDQLIKDSPYMQNMMAREIHHKKELINGSVILGLTAGASSGNSGSNNSRGQRGDLIVVDEGDYIGSAQITNFINIRNEAPDRIKIICSSTPSGKHEEFYRWCTGATVKYFPKQEDVDNFRFTEYIKTDSRDNGDNGNGWTEIFAPSIVNKELLKINPITQQTYLQDIKDELTELRYEQEVMANFGDEELGVYQRKFINLALKMSTELNHKYLNINNKKEVEKFNRFRNGVLVLGVDWDKFQSGTTLVCTFLDKNHTDIFGNLSPIFKVLFRIEIPKTQFTYVNAVNKIIELNDMFNFDHIAIDRGYGETQLEMIHKYGKENPQTGLHKKTVGYQFSQKIEVMDPYTKKKDKKPLKPFMVNNSVLAFEKSRILLDNKDKVLIKQIEDYKIKNISSTGLPIFTDENEHGVDALNLCLLIIEQNHNDLFKKVLSNKIVPISEFSREEDIENRYLFLEDEYKKDNKNNIFKIKTKNKSICKTRSYNFHKRRSF